VTELKCARCGKVVAKEDRRFKGEQLQPRNGATISFPEGQAPRVRCACGMLTIVIRGMLS